ncbi:unnamed protein product [marine sediment metagenome]|uniref:Uncharacterized protein n=1 Tax=marine sediment metagenome TaxID=412755 RepID=X1EL70_9ZZZZ
MEKGSYFGIVSRIEDEMNYTMVSIDGGQNGAMALWEDVLVKEVKGWSFNPKRTLSENICDIVDSVRLIIQHHRPIIVMERPGRQMHIQWVMYSDIRQVAQQFRCGFYGYVPPTIKKQVTGNGHAGKPEMKTHVWSSGLIIDVEQRKVMLDDEHKVDAVAVGICHMRKEKENA